MRKALNKNSGFYILAAVLIIVMLTMVSLTITRTMFGSFSNQPLTKFFFNHLADAILLLAPCWVIKRRRTYTFIILWLVAIWSFAQMLYYPTYRDVMPFSSFLLFKNVSGTLIKSTIGAITKKSLMVLLMPLLLHAYHWWLKHKTDEASKPAKRHWWMFAASIAAFVLLRLIITTSIYLTNRQNYDDLHDAFSTRYTKFTGRHLNYIMHNGVMSYAIFSLINSIDTGVSDDERQLAENFVKTNCPTYTDNSHKTSIERPNLIFIMVESLNAWAVNLDIDSKPVTPTLNSLAADSANIVCLNMISQAKSGHSSDGKFMYQTGLLPVIDRSVAMEYSDRTFPSLVKALKQRGYKTIEICGDEPSLWNVENMSQAYGFDELFHQPELKAELEAADYKIDKVVMEYSAKYLPTIRGNFMAQLFTGVMHSPYDEDFEPATWISASKQYTSAVRNYLEKTHYFDMHLGIFLESLKQSGLYDNSVIVIASDHCEPVDDAPNGRPSLSKNGNECVLIVINGGHGKLISGPIGQIDIYPTLLDVMGLNDYQWKGLGHSLLRYNVSSAAETTDETFGTSPQLKQQQEAWTVSDILIRGDMIKNLFNSNK
ncbi:MAG: sulfatase-like hydrolase/transferase [Muribaculaceae bacterium]|nr:sulfatase-like hydrolase/transferase [Muribaculaceae bacterium]